MPETTGLENKIPVFTTPHNQITFYADDPSSYKQILTIINPYEFLVKFKILISSNDSKKYTVSTPQGTIKPIHSVDVILKHVDVSASCIGIADKVRVVLYASNSVGASGKKDLSIILLDSAPKERASSSSIEPYGFQQLEADPSTSGQLRQHPFIQEKRSNKFWVIFFLTLAAIVLSLPKEGDNSQYIPSFIPLPNHEMKLVVAFLTGILCFMLFQS